MNIDTEKRIDSILSYIKGELISNFNEEDAIAFVEWSKKTVSDTIKDRKEKAILTKLKDCKNEEERRKLILVKKKYLPNNYPIDLKIGDIVHVNYGFGYCSELSDGHYGIILSEFRANTYFVMPLGSEPLKAHTFYFDDFDLPNKDGLLSGKKSYLQFNQMGNIHYRRIENIRGSLRKNIGDEKIRIIFGEIVKFLNLDF